jgi:hypothetical protein
MMKSSALMPRPADGFQPAARQFPNVLAGWENFIHGKFSAVRTDTKPDTKRVKNG